MNIINPEEAQNYISTLRMPRCTLCGKFNWDFKLSTVIVSFDDSQKDYVAVTCKDCGNTIFIDPEFAGLHIEKE